VDFVKEIEAKIINVNRSQIEKKLFSLGASKIFDGEIETTLFDFEDKAIVKAKNVLRLRKEKGKAELTFKKVNITKEAKIAEEYSVEVSSLEGMKKILECLGLSIIESMQKHRVSYTLNQARFDIDKYGGAYGFIPEFLEIEAENAEALHKNAELLGFSAKDCLPWSTQELIQHYSSNTSN
jgi:predicted adenylyl cyclase CyaB